MDINWKDPQGIHPSQRKMEFDIYISGLNLAIEIQGKHHRSQVIIYSFQETDFDSIERMHQRVSMINRREIMIKWSIVRKSNELLCKFKILGKGIQIYCLF